VSVTWSLGLKALKEQFIIAKQRITSEIGAVQTCSSALAMNRTWSRCRVRMRKIFPRLESEPPLTTEAH